MCLGRQPSSDTYVLGPELQFYANGRCVPVEDQDFIWVPEVIEKLHLHRLISPRDSLPQVSAPLPNLLRGLCEILGPNAISGLFMLGRLFIVKG